MIAEKSLTTKPLVFTGSNWTEYRVRVRAMALASDMRDILDGKVTEEDFEDSEDETEKEAFLTKRNYLYSYLVNTQSPETLATVVDVEEGDARGVWERLLRQYESSTKASLKNLIGQLVEMKQGSKPVAEFVSAVMGMKRRIEDIATQNNINIMDELSMMVLIQGLPNSMNVLKSQLSLDDTLTLDKCRRQIVDSTELLTLKKSEGIALRTNSKDKKEKKCDHKNHPGGPDQCWILHPELRPKNKKNKKLGRSNTDLNTQEVANRTVVQTADTPDITPLWNRHVKSMNYARAVATRPVEEGMKRFVVDSGSTDHFSNSPEGLDNFNASSSMRVAVANGQINHTKGVGEISGKLKEVHVMESFNDNLLSVSKLYDEGRIVLFSKQVNGVLIADAKNFRFQCDAPLVYGHHEHGTFTVDIPLNKGKALSTTAGVTDSEINDGSPTATDITHLPPNAQRRKDAIQRAFRRSGYQNPDKLLYAQRHGLLTGLGLPNNARREEFEAESCDAYKQGRMKAHPHYDRGGMKRTEIPYEIVHFDMKVVNEPAYQRYRYAVILTDDYSRYESEILLQSKADLVEELNKWHQQNVVRRGYKVRQFRCDNAGEQKSYEYDKFMTEIAAKTEYTNAYSSASNGIAERSIQTSWNTMQCLRFGAGLPRKAWAELLRVAVRLHNLLPNIANPGGKSPYEMLYGTPPDLSYLRTIGSKAYVYKHKPERVALDPKAEVGRLIGYAIDTNGYRILMDPTTGRIVETNHVTFAETVKDSPEMLVSMAGPDPETEYYRSGPVIPTTTNQEEQLRSILKLPSMQKTNSKVGTKAAEHYNGATETLTDSVTIAPEVAVNDIVTVEDEGEVGEHQAPPQEVDNDHMYIPEPVLDHLEEKLKKEYYQYFPRRSERQRQEPNRLRIPHNGNSKSYLIQSVARRVASQALSTKISHREALADKRICKSMLTELSHLFKTNVIEITDLPPGHKAIGVVWAHKLKHDIDGEFIKAKSRICPWGFDQVPGVSYDPNKVEAPTLRLETIMTLLTTTVNRGMHSRNVDVDGAFTIPENPHPTYMRSPKGLNLPPGKVLKLNKALYGTKQAAYYWNELINEKLLKMGFSRSLIDPCLYYRWEDQFLSLIGLYVDDIRIVCDKFEDLDIIEQGLRADFPIKVPPENSWIGIKIIHDRTNGTMELTSGKYIGELLKLYNMEDCNPVATPAAPGSKLRRCEKTEELSFPYRELVGNLLWLARTTRPDILYAVNQLCAHVLSYGEAHIIAAKRVLRYLKGTRDLPLRLTRQSHFTLEVYADADFAGEPEENEQAMKSLSGMVVYIKGVGPIYSQSKLQSTISTSTSEAELKSVGAATQFILPLRQLLEEIGFKYEVPTAIYNDNASCIASLHSQLSGSKLRHVKVNFHFVKEKIKSKDITVNYLTTEEMLADIMTKALHAPRFLKLRDILMNTSSARHGGVSE